MSPRTFAALSFTSFALGACSVGTSTTGTNDGKYHPTTNGQAMSETDACNALSMAISGQRSNLSCVGTTPTCPSLVQEMSGETRRVRPGLCPRLRGLLRAGDELHGHLDARRQLRVRRPRRNGGEGLPLTVSGRILPRFDFRVDIVSRSEKGPVRELNEDAMLVAPHLALFGLADGMGGLEAGEVASAMALDAAKDVFASKESMTLVEGYVSVPNLENRRRVLSLMRRACERAHEDLLAEQDRRGPEVSMGTTLDLCLFVRDRAFFAHVGDGRVFLSRPSATLLITQDHVREGEARYGSRGPKPLSSAVGVRTPLRVDTFFVDVHKNDRVVLATDGAYSAVSDEATMTRLCQRPPETFVRDLLALSLEKGGRDNASVIVVRVADRFLARAQQTSQREHDFGAIQENPLFAGLPMPKVLAALAAGIEVDVEETGKVSPVDAGDLCAYLVLDGVVKLPSGTSLGAPALLFGESLVGVSRDATPATVASHARLIRVRGDDFREVCEHEAVLGAAL